MTKASLRTALTEGRFIVAPGIHDMITAVVSNKVGFEFVYSSGYWGTASGQGIPDAGIATYTEMLDRVETLCRTADAGVIADADTGYGGLLNVDHTVRGYERAGATAIQIEDQEFPKKCGHTPNKRVVPTQDMVEKIKVACAARENKSETLIIARTDARQVEGFDGAVERGLAYRGCRRRHRICRGPNQRRGNAHRLRTHLSADDGEHVRWRKNPHPLGDRAG